MTKHIKTYNTGGFSLLTVKSVKKIGTLDIESNVVVGESFYSPDEGFKEFGKGKYYVYYVNDNLVLSKKLLDQDKIKKMQWFQVASFFVDGGQFGFWDKIHLDQYAKFFRKKHKKHSFGDIPIFNFNRRNIYFEKISNCMEKDLFINNGYDPNTVVGVVSSTATGDGTFSCYMCSDTALMLVGGYTDELLYNEDKSRDDEPNICLLDMVAQAMNANKGRRRKTSKKSSRKKNSRKRKNIRRTK